jgi:hypothetical protein
VIDNSPFLFVHLPLDEIRGGQLLDASPNRRHAIPHLAVLADDETFGHCLDFAAPRSYAEFPPWKLNPDLFLAPTPTKLTISAWISPVASDVEGTILDCGFRPGLQRLKIRLRRTGQNVQFTVLAPANRERERGVRWTAEAAMPAGAWLHFALIWDPIGEGADRDCGSCDMFLNGGFFSSYGNTNGERPGPPGGAVAFQTLLGGPGFRGKLAHLRIHTRALAQEEINRQIDQDRAALRLASPIECALLDPNNKPMMFLDASPVGEKMQFIVKPVGNGLTLGGLLPGPIGPDNCHFEIAARPGTLDLRASTSMAATAREGRDDWEAKAFPKTTPDGHDSICVRCVSPEPLTSELRIVLSFLMADRRFAARWTLLDLRYRNVNDAQGRLLGGRIPQWLELAPRVPQPPPSVPSARVQPVWNKGSNSLNTKAAPGRIILEGHMSATDVAGLLRLPHWHILALLLPGYPRPFGTKTLRFPGRVRWISSAPPEPATVWLGDIVLDPGSSVSVSTDVPPEVLKNVSRIEVSFDGVSYSSEKSLVVS